nr:MAG TPA: hypothetical protein [Caudoviricetes sp.]
MYYVKDPSVFPPFTLGSFFCVYKGVANLLTNIEKYCIISIYESR